jgi:myo-inositol-1(or 4)-monophosphatase
MTDVSMHLRFSAACAIAREAGCLIRERFLARDEALNFKFKGPQDYLTETDGEVEKLIATRIAEAFPDDAFLGEESGGQLGERLWIVDPIDGTADFARGVPYFCVSIAYVEHGATLNGKPIKVSPVTDIRQSVVELGWSARTPFERYTKLLGKLNAQGAGVKRRGSGALGLAYVAMGRQDAYCELHINAWDAAAGVLLVEEAGGWTNDFLTQACLTEGNQVIACTPSLRDVLETTIKETP